MRGFISWAKDDRSRIVAEALRDLLPDLIHSLKLWSSSTDLRAGVRWSEEIADALSAAEVGIVCVTAFNQREPWLLFESGVLAKALPRTLVCPYLIQMREADLTHGPLKQFQSKLANREGTWDLVSMLNGALGTGALPTDRLERNFDRWWPALEAKLNTLEAVPVPVQLTQTEMLVEILDAVRSAPHRTLPNSSRSSNGPARLSRAKQVDRVLEFLGRTGQVDTNRSPDVRRHLAQMPPPDLASVYHMVRESTTKNGGPSDATIHSIMTKIGTSRRPRTLSVGSEA